MPHASIGIPRWNGPNLTDKDNCFMRLQKVIMDTTNQRLIFFSQICDVAKVATIHMLILPNLTIKKNEMKNSKHPYTFLATYLTPCIKIWFFF